MMDILDVTSGLDVSRLSKWAVYLINSINWIAIDVNTILMSTLTNEASRLFAMLFLSLICNDWIEH
jgi:hypothetical protein